MYEGLTPKEKNGIFEECRNKNLLLLDIQKTKHTEETHN